MSDHEQFVIEDLMKYLGKAVDYTMRDNVGHKGFMIIVFNFHDPTLANYVSNCNREDAIKALRTTADRLEKGEIIPKIENRTVQ